MSTNSDLIDVAHVEGIGCSYVMHRDTDTGKCMVTMFGGPARKVILEDATWLEAMAHIANEVESDLATEVTGEQTAQLAVVSMSYTPSLTERRLAGQRRQYG